ncbi:MAG TPA: DNA repair protein RadC [Tenuifilaceae bacterium]|nr:DNA repair protein RadC [Tenuifilaceae bacterium]HPE19569.1 DNA repair protein RadC [Tenuifilaceae bacterium]HPJ46164.1 DNA repair protein RadC [Tenuifilaceae bacterium]HPQ34682.1 DNA repair protein RadC [Tenuifilaceae bacterium]HRX68110.1 DNA repair protein RadC [Tenuifilaceae bacterium]
MEQNSRALTIKEWALDDRPREKMMSKGIGALSDAELMAILIGTGTRNETAVAISQRILGIANNNLNELGKYSLSDLTKIKGIGPAKAITIMAALELGRRRKISEALSKKQISSSKDVIDIFQPQLADLPHEEFWILLLNRANRIIAQVKVSEGGQIATVVDTRKIMRLVLEYQALGIILCHNHPSGNHNPSNDDIKITQKLKAAASTLEVNLLDHIIVTDGQCYSMADEGVL